MAATRAGEGMTPVWAQDGLALHLGDCREVLASLPQCSVSTVITSPPFWGLRKYDCPPSIWGGDPECPHRLEAEPMPDAGYSSRQRWQHKDVSRQETPEAWVKEPARQKDRQHLKELGERDGSHGGVKASSFATVLGGTSTCSLCGAWRGWYGLEPTVAMYVEHTVEVLRAIRRVMRPDGCLFWDLDDSRGSTKDNMATWQMKDGRTGHGGLYRPGNIEREADKSIPAKSLCLIPQRVAIAAQDDGWIVRSQIIIKTWMPESARDRPTDAYRVVLMMTKTSKPTFYWNEETLGMAPRPPAERVYLRDWEWRLAIEDGEREKWTRHSYWHGEDYWYDNFAVRVPQSSTQDRAQPEKNEGYYQARDGSLPMLAGATYRLTPDGLRNLGNVWELPPSAYPAAHFATFPVEEPELAIRASCPPEVCRACGLARVRVVEKQNIREHPAREGRKDRNVADFDGEGYEERESGLGLTADIQTTGWTSCEHGDYEPGLVLDPFVGTGTTLVAARKLGRRAIGIDQSQEYIDQAITRLTVGDAGVRRIVAARRAGAEQSTLL